MSKLSGYDTRYTQNRELSWLRFNERVLEEAGDSAVPAWERLKFTAIFTSNLDEFFMIRVGSLFDLSLVKQQHVDNKTNWAPEQQLKQIYARMPFLYRLRDQTYAGVESQLRSYGIANCSWKELTAAERKFAERYYRETVEPVLSPQIIDSRHPFPHLPNKRLYVALHLSSKGKEEFGLVGLPEYLPRILILPGSGLRYLLMERLLLEYAGRLFHQYGILGKAVICVTRNADVNPDDESYEVEDDYRQQVKKALRKRLRLAPVRLETDRGATPELTRYLTGKLHLKRDQVCSSRAPLDFSYVYSLLKDIPPTIRRSVTYPPYEPQLSPLINPRDSLIRQIQRQDLLLSYPYESMEPFLQLLREAANDPAVISIKITIYRLASKSRLVEYLSAAAENGKDVWVLMELRARFDEENNINWSETLEDAGCKILYGFEDFKVHAKVCQITRRERGKIQYITQIGTGNYNEKTAALYTDFSLMTADPILGEDASDFFKNMAIANLEGNYREFLVAPHRLKPELCRLIDRQIERARQGKKAHIRAKVNAISDRALIDKLAQASRAGVRIELIVRGICCILPGIPGLTEHITVVSVVGRYLEHARVYAFWEEEGWKVYLASADWMTRNLSRRVEIACPVKDPNIRQAVVDMLDVMLSDDQKGRCLDAGGSYFRPRTPALQHTDSQACFMEQALKRSSAHAENRLSPRRLFHRLRRREKGDAQP